MNADDIESALQERPASGFVVFISHRWCRDKHPDDEDHAKYKLLCRGLRAIMKRDRLDEALGSVWMDYACIDQDDEAKLLRGVASLVSV
eukprot:g117.t1